MRGGKEGGRDGDGGNKRLQCTTNIGMMYMYNVHVH